MTSTTPKEGKCKTQIFSRVTGFYTAVAQWNPGKKEEFKERTHYDLKKAQNNQGTDK